MTVDLGTLPQQVTALSTGGIFVSLMALLLRWNLGRGKLANEAQAQHDNDEANIRDHYAKEVDRLTHRVEQAEDRYRRLLSESEEDRERLRDRVSHLEDEIRGLIRLITYNSAHVVLQLGDDAPEDIRDAAKRVRSILDENRRRA